MSVSDESTTSSRRMIIFLGVVFALGSLGIDSILPSLGAIAYDLHLGDPDRAQLLVTSFVAGMGLGSLFGGPLSDQYGRRPIILAGCLLYVAGALSAMCAGSLTVILAARVVQGMGGAFTTVAATAWIRDQHSGVKMARIMSFAMTVFSIMPAVAPFMGKFIAAVAGWRAIFAVYAMVGVCLSWRVVISVHETLTVHRIRLNLRSMMSGGREVLSIRQIQLAIAGQTMNMAVLFSALSSIQPIFDKTFDRAGSFPAYFAAMATAIALAGYLNGKLVARVGSQHLVLGAFGLNTILSLLILCVRLHGGEWADREFVWFCLWATATFFTQGLATGNLSALALEPAGQLAGLASSFVASIPMLLATPLAMFVGLQFQGGPKPLEFAVLVFSALGCVVVTQMRRPLRVQVESGI